MKALVKINDPSITSITIAEMVESRHADVKRSISRLITSGIIDVTPLAFCGRINGLGLNQKIEHYVFTGPKGKRDSIVVIAQLSPVFTARLVDRWMELEAHHGEQVAFKSLLIDKRASHRPMSDAIESFREFQGRGTVKLDFIKENKMINKILTGKYEGIDESLLTPEGLEFLAELRKHDTSLLKMFVDRSERKVLLNKFADASKKKLKGPVLKPVPQIGLDEDL
jgi:phage regulator Rha-like protein